MNVSQLSQQLTDKAKKLEEELQISDNYASLKQKLLDLKTELQDLAPDLSSYELELHSKRVDKLLKQLEERRNSALGAGNKVLQFTKKPNIKVNLNQFKEKLATDKTISSGLPLSFPLSSLSSSSSATATAGSRSNEDLLVSENGSGVFRNLTKCTISTPSDLVTGPDSGALTFQKMDTCVVSLTTLPFKSGSLFFTDISNSVIIVCIPTGHEVQIRLHNLTDCSISVQYANYSIDKQTVVVENLKRCVFQESSKSQINIQNFNDVLGSSSDSEYQFKFGYFDTYMNDVHALREHYITHA